METTLEGLLKEFVTAHKEHIKHFSILTSVVENLQKRVKELEEERNKK